MGNETDWGKVLAVLLAAGAIGGGLYLILKPTPEIGGKIISQTWTKEEVGMPTTGVLREAELILAHLRPKSQLWGRIASPRPTYQLGELTTCIVRVKNTGNTPFEPEVEAHLYYERTWPLSDLMVTNKEKARLGRQIEPGEQVDITVRPRVVTSGIPAGLAEGWVSLYDAATAQLLDELSNWDIAQIVVVAAGEIVSQTWV